MRFRRVLTYKELSDGKGTAVKLEGRAVVLFRSGDAVFALDNLCPHAGARLESGKVTAGVVSCPLHGAKFELATGICRSAHVAGNRRIVTHHVRVVDGEVEIALADEAIVTSSGLF